MGGLKIQTFDYVQNTLPDFSVIKKNKTYTTLRMKLENKSIIAYMIEKFIIASS